MLWYRKASMKPSHELIWSHIFNQCLTRILTKKQDKTWWFAIITGFWQVCFFPLGWSDWCLRSPGRGFPFEFNIREELSFLSNAASMHINIQYFSKTSSFEARDELPTLLEFKRKVMERLRWELRVQTHLLTLWEASDLRLNYEQTLRIWLFSPSEVMPQSYTQ